MKPFDEFSDRLCREIQKSFPPTRKVTCDGGICYHNERPILTLVVAHVLGKSLAPFDDSFVARIKGKSIQTSDKKVLIAGTLDGREYEIRLLCVPA